MFERLVQVWYLIQSIPLYVTVIELALLWIVVYLVFRFLRGTRGAGVIKGVVLLLVVVTLVIKILGSENAFERLNFLYSNFLTFISLALVIVFQPELRRALTKIGEARFFRGNSLRRAKAIEEIVAAVEYLSRHYFGALIVIERRVPLREVVEAGVRLDAEITTDLLKSIFWPGNALHDLAVVIRGERVVAARVQLPLTEAMGRRNAELGSRHRAAIGLSQESDALIVIVSEETGTISLAEHGGLNRHLSTDELRTELARGLGRYELVANDYDDQESADDTAPDKAGQAG